MFAFILLGLALLSAGLNLWQWIAANRFPLHQRQTDSPNKASAITLLKPLKGFDSETLACLESWFQQIYSAPIQILFGVASADDPVCNLVGQLMARYPQVNAQLQICPKEFGANAKVATLIQLESLARHPFIIISDADVFVPNDFVSQIMRGFSSATIGLVNCFYKIENPRSAAMQWEAVAINADFWSQVLQGNSLKSMDFALGAVMAIRSESLRKIGGFASLADYLADDYQLGHKIAEEGGSIVIAPVIASCRGAIMGWRAVWNHQLRWARTIRVCQSVPWFFSILSNATVWPLLAATILETRLAFGLFAAAVFLRILTALHNQFRLTRSCEHLVYFWLIPVKDILQFALWAGSFLGSTVVWRGTNYRVLPGGKLVVLK